VRNGPLRACVRQPNVGPRFGWRRADGRAATLAGDDSPLERALEEASIFLATGRSSQPRTMPDARLVFDAGADEQPWASTSRSGCGRAG
jgi:hypothetical protein